MLRETGKKIWEKKREKDKCTKGTQKEKNIGNR
jgi:hypothetical protein